MDVATTISRNPYLCPNIKISWEQPPVQSVVHSNRKWCYETLRWRWAWEGEAPDFTFVDTGPRLCLRVQCSCRTEQAQAFPVPCLVGLCPTYHISRSTASACHPCVHSECLELWKQFQSFQVSHSNFQHRLLAGENILLYLKFLQMSHKPKASKQTNKQTLLLLFIWLFNKYVLWQHGVLDWPVLAPPEWCLSFSNSASRMSCR